MLFKVRRLVLKIRLILNSRFSIDQKCIQTQSKTTFFNQKINQNVDGTKKYKTRFQRRSPTPPFWSQVRFLANFGSGLGPAGSQNRLRGAPGTLQNHHRSSSRRRNRPNRLPGGSRKAPRHTQGPPRDHFWMISDRFPKVILE